MQRLFARLATLALAHRIALGVCWGQVQVTPDVLTVIYGQVVSGDMSAFIEADGLALRMSRFTVPNVPVDPVTFRLEAKLPFKPVGLKFVLLARSITPGPISQSINLYDWTRNLFDPLTNVTGPLPKTFVQMECNAQGDVSRYVRPGDNKVMALVRARPTGPVAVLLWQVEYDLANFQAVSGP